MIKFIRCFLLSFQITNKMKTELLTDQKNWEQLEQWSDEACSLKWHISLQIILYDILFSQLFSQSGKRICSYMICSWEHMCMHTHILCAFLVWMCATLCMPLHPQGVGGAGMFHVCVFLLASYDPLSDDIWRDSEEKSFVSSTISTLDVFMSWNLVVSFKIVTFPPSNNNYSWFLPQN